jgi:cytochrome b subunit of formate dehydrogenase
MCFNGDKVIAMVRTWNRDLCNSIGIALFVGIFSGIGNVLVDIDHLISFTFGWPTTMSRFLHPYAVIIGGIIFIACIACMAGLLGRSILRKKHV